MNQPLILLTLILFANSAKLPSTFKKCNRNSPDFKACLLEAAQNAIVQLDQPMKEVRLPSLEPLEVSGLRIPSGGGSVSVDQDYKDCKIFGFVRFVFDNFEFDFEKKQLKLLGLFDQVRMECQYKVDGKVLLMPVKGEGFSRMTLKNVKAAADFDFVENARKGKTYINFVDQKISLQPENAHFQFDDLFNGNKEMSDNINNVINDNWQQVFDETRSGFESGLGQMVMGLLNGFFSKVPLEEAFDS